MEGMRGTALAALSSAFLASTTLGCSDANVEPAREVVPMPYDVPLRTDAELASELDALCVEATEASPRPVLIEFSAAWCGDCRKLGTMKRAPALATELREWPRLVVNVARFDRHRPLLDAMDVDSIAHWAVLAPTDCAEPVERWPRLAARTLEVSSGAARHLRPEDLARWLRRLRS